MTENKQKQHQTRTAEELRRSKPPIEAFDPFAIKFRSDRRSDSFDDMFEEKIMNDEF